MSWAITGILETGAERSGVVNIIQMACDLNAGGSAGRGSATLLRHLTKSVRCLRIVGRLLAACRVGAPLTCSSEPISALPAPQHQSSVVVAEAETAFGFRVAVDGLPAM